MEDKALSIEKQCEILNLPRSSYYHQSASETPLNLEIMRLIDEQHTHEKVPYGQKKLVRQIQEKLNIPINRKRIQRLMRIMGLEGLYQKRKTTIPGKNHKIYPYLLRNRKIAYPNQVWGTDITYIPMKCGFMFLVAIQDWFSRYVISWELSNTLDKGFCIQALNGALKKAAPKIFNSDQGSQFTALNFTSILEYNNIQISMDGRGRSLDNIFIERLWRSLKYEDIYRQSYETVSELKEGLEEYFYFYNRERLHQALGYKTPYDFYLMP